MVKQSLPICVKMIKGFASKKFAYILYKEHLYGGITLQYYDINTLKYNFKDNPFNASLNLFAPLKSITNALYAPGDDELKTLWIKVKNPSYETFRKDLLEEDEFAEEDDIRYEYEKYSEPYSFYQIKEITLTDGRSFVYIDNDLIASYDPKASEVDMQVKSSWFRISKENFDAIIRALKDTVTSHIAMLKSGTYKKEVLDQLPYYLKTGTINRKDYYMAVHKEKVIYDEFDGFKNKEEFLGETDIFMPEVNKSFRIHDMTAKMFFNACLAGYIENECATIEDDAKSKYYKNADGRDEGLSEVPLDDSVAFHQWFHKREYGGHPWEIMRGGNSTHVSLYVCEDEQGYYFIVDGRSENRFLETINCYIAIKRMGYPVMLNDSALLKERLQGKETIGIVPKDIFPRYCENMFPSRTIHNFMNLWEEDLAALPYVTWQEIPVPELND